MEAVNFTFFVIFYVSDVVSREKTQDVKKFHMIHVFCCNRET